MQEPTKKTIDGHTYEFQTMGAKQSVKMLIRLSKILGEPISIAASFLAGPGKLSEREISPDAIPSAVKALLARVDQDDALDIIETLTSKNVLCDHKPIVFDKHFEGRLGHLFQVLKAALEVQYGNFIEGILGEVGSLRPATAQASQA